MLNRIATGLFILSFVLPGATLKGPAAQYGIGWDYMNGSFTLMRMIFDGDSDMPFSFKAYVVGFSWIANIGFLTTAAQRHFKESDAASWTSPIAIASAALGTLAVLLFCTDDNYAWGLAPVGWSLALVLGAVASFQASATTNRS